MTILELAEVARLRLVVKYTPDVSPGVQPWLTSLEKDFGHVGHKDNESDSTISGGCGYGDTPLESITDYCRYIAGRVLAIDDSSGVRVYVRVPKSIEASEQARP